MFFLLAFLENNKLSTWKEKLSLLIENIPCAYCLLIITKNGIYALRDRFGIRPLCIGKYNDNYL